MATERPGAIGRATSEARTNRRPATGTLPPATGKHICERRRTWPTSHLCVAITPLDDGVVDVAIRTARTAAKQLGSASRDCQRAFHRRSERVVAVYYYYSDQSDANRIGPNWIEVRPGRQDLSTSYCGRDARCLLINDREEAGIGKNLPAKYEVQV